MIHEVSRSVERLITGIRERLIETEPNMTDRLLGNIEDRGWNSSESLYGADLAT